MSQFPILVEEDGTRLGTFVHIGEQLGVTAKQVFSWAARRSSNGFPEPARRGVLLGRKVDLYDIDEVRVWHMFYTPTRGRPAPQYPDRGGPAAIGRLLGVDTKQVCKWIDRRASNSCPEPGPDGLYSFSDWTSWRTRYTPSVGGRRRTA